MEAKRKGYADRQIAHLLKCLESKVHERRHAEGITRVYKLVDTCAAEFPAVTPYYYSTFEEEENESEVSDRKKVIVLGSGPNRIGQGIEFDYCCVHGVLAAKECGYETIMIAVTLKLYQQIQQHQISYTSVSLLGAHLRHHPSRKARRCYRTAWRPNGT